MFYIRMISDLVEESLGLKAPSQKSLKSVVLQEKKGYDEPPKELIQKIQTPSLSV
jgi:hypothetical protein